MAKYQSSINSIHHLARGHSKARRNPYEIIDLYRRLTDLYERRPKLRRGYSDRLYSPSRKHGSSGPSPRPRTTYQPRTQYQPEPPYRPSPRQNYRGNYRPWTDANKYAQQRANLEQDVEQMLRQLGERFDKKLHEQVLKKMESEFKELQEAIEKNETSDSAAIQEEIETLDGTINKEVDSKLGGVEPSPQDGEKIIEAKAEKREETEPKKADDESPTEKELYEVEDKLEWLREQAEPTETKENEATGPKDLLEESVQVQASETPETLEPLTSKEPIEQSALENQPLSEAATLENSGELGVEQLAGLEELLDQIEPIEEIEPLETGIESMSGILPEMLPEAIEEEYTDEAVESESY